MEGYLKIVFHFLCYIVMIKNVIDFVVFATILFLTFWEENDHVDIICCVVGVFGLCYISYHIFKFLFNPIKRDLLLMSGKFLRRVLFVVLFVPYVISMFSICRDKICNCENDPLHSTSGLLFPGDDDRADATNASDHVFWSVYYHFVDPGNQHIAVEKYGRNLAALIALLGVFLLNGLLISTLIGWFDNRKERWTNGDIRYGRLTLSRKKYAVVIGVDDNAPTIMRNLLTGKGESDKLDYVLVLTNFDVEAVRSLLYSHLEEQDKKKVIIYRGQLDAFEQMADLHLDMATEVYVLGEKQKEDEAYSYHDIQNMKIVHNIASDLTVKGFGSDSKLVCRVLFEYQTTFSIFQFSDLPDKIIQRIDFIPFNNYEDWAHCVLVKGSYTEILKKALSQQNKMDLYDTTKNNLLYAGIRCLSRYLQKRNDEERTFTYLPLEGEKGIGLKDEKTVHFVVVGMSKMGIAMALQAAQVAHYPNFKPENGRRTRITFIDPNADAEKEFFMGRFQRMFYLARHRYLDLSEPNGLQEDWIDPVANVDGDYYDVCGVRGDKGVVRHNNFIDIEWEFIKGNLEKEGVKTYLKESVKEKNTITTIAICHPLAHEAIAAALYMPEEVYKSVSQILVYQREASDMIANFTKGENIRQSYEKIRPFGMSNADFTTDKEYAYRAKLAGYVYSIMPGEEALFAIKDLDSEKKNVTKDINSEILRLGNASDAKKMVTILSQWKDSTTANRWSNMYLANSFELKLRSLGYSVDNVRIYYDAISASIEANKNMLAECEHNRWNTQQLLIGFRAYKKGEIEKYLNIRGVDDKETRAKRKKEKKNNQKGLEKAHLDICSFEKLKELDPGVRVYDEIFNAAIPAILKVTEEARLHPMSRAKQQKKTPKKV